MARNETLVGCVGAGRMGRGIALTFAYAGYSAALIDLKPRLPDAWDEVVASAREEIEADLRFLLRVNQLDEAMLPGMMARIRYVCAHDAPETLAQCAVIFEGVPEIVTAKQETFRLVEAHATPECIIASTTSTVDANLLSKSFDRPERFLNAHWLNPAHLVPLIEVSPSDLTAPETTAALCDLLRGIGKVPVVCKSSPGYIVPRLQGLVMNEAARMVEEGVASAEDIDTAVRMGFGLRFSVLGLLEFIDWGGCDILHYGTAFLREHLGERYAAPAIVAEHMESGRRGIRDGKGFYDYGDMDVSAYRESRLADFANVLRQRGIMPLPGE